MRGRQFHFVTAILGLLALVCFQEVSIAEVPSDSSQGNLVIVENQADMATLALLKLIDESEVESIAQVEVINSGRFQPYLAGKDAKEYVR